MKEPLIDVTSNEKKTMRARKRERYANFTDKHGRTTYLKHLRATCSQEHRNFSKSLSISLSLSFMRKLEKSERIFFSSSSSSSTPSFILFVRITLASKRTLSTRTQLSSQPQTQESFITTSIYLVISSHIVPRSASSVVIRAQSRFSTGFILIASSRKHPIRRCNAASRRNNVRAQSMKSPRAFAIHSTT